MLPFKLVYSDGYCLPIGEHVFPAEKFRLVRARLLETGIAGAEDFLEPAPAADEDILRVHTPGYVRKLKTGTLSAQEELQLEVPFSPALVRAFWLAAGGSILAAERALADGACCNLGGGFHHAFPDHGEGFCMIHDVAVAIRHLQHEGKIKTAMIVDCDVHHGNGTAAIFATEGGSRPAALPALAPAALRGASACASEPSAGVFTISLHQQNNYPAIKPPSSIDVNLRDGVSDADYLSWLDYALSSAFRRFTPDLLCYIAGADPYCQDQLGGLALTMQGLRQRDELVLRAARARGLPVMTTQAGGYARKLKDTVTIHCNTVLAAKELFAANRRE